MKTLLIAGTALMLAAAPAMANEMKMKEHFKMMDTNHDGMISKEEHAASAEKMFMEADANKDGKLSETEMAAFKKQKMGDYKPASGKMDSKMDKSGKHMMAPGKGEPMDPTNTEENMNIKDTKPETKQ